MSNDCQECSHMDVLFVHGVRAYYLATTLAALTNWLYALHTVWYPFIIAWLRYGFERLDWDTQFHTWFVVCLIAGSRPLSPVSLAEHLWWKQEQQKQVMAKHEPNRVWKCEWHCVLRQWNQQEHAHTHIRSSNDTVRWLNLMRNKCDHFACLIPLSQVAEVNIQSRTFSAEITTPITTTTTAMTEGTWIASSTTTAKRLTTHNHCFVHETFNRQRHQQSQRCLNIWFPGSTYPPFVVRLHSSSAPFNQFIHECLKTWIKKKKLRILRFTCISPYSKHPSHSECAICKWAACTDKISRHGRLQMWER